MKTTVCANYCGGPDVLVENEDGFEFEVTRSERGVLTIRAEAGVTMTRDEIDAIEQAALFALDNWEPAGL